MNDFENMKFRVKSVEEVDLLKTKLEKLGYTWTFSMVPPEKIGFIYAYSDGRCTWDAKEPAEFNFNDKNHPEYEIIHSIDIAKLPDYIIWNNCRYKKDEFESAIKNLRTL